MSFFTRNLNSDFSQDILYLGAAIMAIPIWILIQSLLRDVPSPVRFNRQRREVCLPRENGEYWLVPWESVTAAATQHSSVSQAGKATMGLLIIGFENPDPQAKEDNKHFSFGFNCGGGSTAMALWECTRSYMEVGPDAVPNSRVGFTPYEKTQIGSLMIDLRKGDLIGVIWGVFCITILGTYFAEKLQNLKLSSPLTCSTPTLSNGQNHCRQSNGQSVPQNWKKPSPSAKPN
jgi:hypothetical protein